MDAGAVELNVSTKEPLQSNNHYIFLVGLFK